MEIWKAISGYNGRYEVSNFGNVRSNVRQPGTPLTQYLNNKKTRKRQKYLAVTLRQYAGPRKTVMVHVLVARAFLDGPKVPDRKMLNHLDGISTNNRSDNLEWCTNSENIQHSFRLGLQKPRNMKGELHPRAGITADTVRKIRSELASGKSRKEISEILVMPYVSVCQIANGRRWSHVR